MSINKISLILFLALGSVTTILISYSDFDKGLMFLISYTNLVYNIFKKIEKEI